MRQNNSVVTLLYIHQHPNTDKTHTHTHTVKRKCSRGGGGIMLGMWSRSCSMPVIPALRGFELSGRLDLYSVSLCDSNLLHLALYLSVSPVSHGSAVGWISQTRLEMNWLWEEKRESEGITLKQGLAGLSLIFILCFSGSHLGCSLEWQFIFSRGGFRSWYSDIAAWDSWDLIKQYTPLSWFTAISHFNNSSFKTRVKYSPWITNTTADFPFSLSLFLSISLHSFHCQRTPPFPLLIQITFICCKDSAATALNHRPRLYLCPCM